MAVLAKGVGKMLCPFNQALLWPSRRAKGAISQSLFLLLANIIYFYVLGFFLEVVSVNHTHVDVSLYSCVREGKAFLGASWRPTLPSP